MWGFSGHQRVAVSFVTGATSPSAAVDLRGANHVALEIPTLASFMSVTTANIYIQGAATASGTFYRIMDEGIYSAGSGIADWEIPSTTGARTVICRPAERFDWIKPELSRVTTQPMTIYVHKHY